MHLWIILFDIKGKAGLQLFLTDPTGVCNYSGGSRFLYRGFLYNIIYFCLCADGHIRLLTTELHLVVSIQLLPAH